MSVQVREIATDFFDDAGSGTTGLRWQSSALLALQEATEAYAPPFHAPLTRQLPRASVRGLESVCAARQARDHHAAGHAARAPDSRRFHVGPSREDKGRNLYSYNACRIKLASRRMG